MSYSVINTGAWPRKATYEFFKSFDDPFFNLTALVDVTALVQYCKATRGSFFLHCLHHASRMANELEPFRLRIKDDKVILYDVVHPGSTILHEDQTFSYCYFDYYPELERFVREGAAVVKAHLEGKGFDPRDKDLEMLHFSFIPWVSFTGFKHARRFGREDSIPKIVFGKYYKEGGRYKIPLSIEVHHALMDGYHVGQYFERFEEMIYQQ